MSAVRVLGPSRACTWPDVMLPGQRPVEGFTRKPEERWWGDEGTEGKEAHL